MLISPVTAASAGLLDLPRKKVNKVSLVQINESRINQIDPMGHLHSRESSATRFTSPTLCAHKTM
jgi:hypothetical protein